MTPDHRAILNRLHRDYLRTQHPSVPEHAIPGQAYEDKTANGLTRCIVDYIRYTGGMAERVANMGRPVKTTGGRVRWIPGGGRNGTADIHATIQGRTVMIEVKIGRDRYRSKQAKYAADITRAGGRYMIVRSFEDFIKQL